MTIFAAVDPFGGDRFRGFLGGSVLVLYVVLLGCVRGLVTWTCLEGHVRFVLGDHWAISFGKLAALAWQIVLEA